MPQEEEEEVRVLTLPLQAHHAMEKMEEFVYKVLSWEGRRAGLSGLPADSRVLRGKGFFFFF